MSKRAGVRGMGRPEGSAFRAILTGLLILGAAVVPGGAHVVPAIRDYDGSAPELLPKALSGTGLYDNAASKARKVTDGIKAYEVNTALWSDGAAKQRFVDVPVGAKIVPTDSDQYTIPDKTVFIKNFSIDTVYGDSSTRILIETRFLVVRKPADQTGKKYAGFTYKWSRDQKDAELQDPGAGLDTAIAMRLNGKTVGKRWSYPSGSDCNQCHRGRGTLGFITPQLNRPDISTPAGAANAAVNQLKALFTAGVLSADPTKAGLHRWIGPKETGTAATAEAKARSYLAANCSHCHGNKQSLDGTEHDFDWFGAVKEIKFPESPGGFVGKPAAKEPGFPQIVYPGYPESSFVVFRMLARGDLGSRSPSQMPPLATYQPDSAAVGIMKDWICSLAAKPRTCSLPAVQDDASYWEAATALFPHRMPSPRVTHMLPVLRGGILSWPAADAAVPLKLTDLAGQAARIAPLGGGRWRAPPLPNGLYLVTDGRHSAILAVAP